MKNAKSVFRRAVNGTAVGLLLAGVGHQSIHAQSGKMPPPIEACASEPVKYAGTEQPDKWFFDGALRYAVGAHRYQVFRANRSHPREGGELGWTYNHQPFLAYWKKTFYLHYLSTPVGEHTPPGRTLLVSSKDGRQWSDPVILFPEYALPEIKREGVHVPAGTPSVMHQRMGFYVAPNGRLLALGFYSYCPTPRHSPNGGQGLGRVVREIYEDGAFGPIYFIRYNRHAGFDEHNTAYPFYRTSGDAGFVKACEDLLADKLMTLQWWEEDRAKDGFFTLDPGDVKNAFNFTANMTTSAGAGKAFCWYHRPDGVVVGLWKNQYSVLSPDNGNTWTGIVKSTTLMECGAKIWGQRTQDGRYALVYDHSATRANRYPMVVMTSENGYEFNHMLCVEGELPPMRFRGIWKGVGTQYFRGIEEGNGEPPGPYLWNTYSVNKEDIWVSRVSVPIRGTVNQQVNDSFEEKASVGNLESWSLHVPAWAPISIVADPLNPGNHCLELRDEDPYDQAVAERTYPASARVRVEFRVLLSAIPQGRALEFEVQDERGHRPMLLRLDRDWLLLDKTQIAVSPLPIHAGRWYKVDLMLDCGSQTYDLALDGEVVRKAVAFADKAQSLERMMFRTGPYRGNVPANIVDGEEQPSGLYIEDLPGADEKVSPSVFLIDDVRTENPRLPRVLLIGDSISQGYAPPVCELLIHKANVYRLPVNGGPTTNGLAHLAEWLGDRKWDVIHFNWGLHDIKVGDSGKCWVSPEDYETNLRRLVDELKVTGATLIWATTTPVPGRVKGIQRRSADVITYNALAKRVMDENGIAIDDLYRSALPQLAKIQLPENVHYTPDGYRALAGPVVANIEAALSKR